MENKKHTEIEFFSLFFFYIKNNDLYRNYYVHHKNRPKNILCYSQNLWYLFRHSFEQDARKDKMTALLRVISLVVISVVVIIIPPGLHLDEERLRDQALTN